MILDDPLPTNDAEAEAALRALGHPVTGTVETMVTFYKCRRGQRASVLQAFADTIEATIPATLAELRAARPKETK